MSEQEKHRSDSSEQTIIRIKTLRPDSRGHSIEFTVFRQIEQRVVQSKKTGRMLRIARYVVADSSAQMILVLWNENTEAVECGRSYRIEGFRVTVRDYSMQISLSRGGRIIPIDRTVTRQLPATDMSRPFAWVQKTDSDRGRIVVPVGGPMIYKLRKFAGPREF